MILHNHVLLTTYKSWDDPPSTEKEQLKTNLKVTPAPVQ